MVSAGPIRPRISSQVSRAGVCLLFAVPLALSGCGATASPSPTRTAAIVAVASASPYATPTLVLTYPPLTIEVSCIDVGTYPYDYVAYRITAAAASGSFVEVASRADFSDASRWGLSRLDPSTNTIGGVYHAREFPDGIYVRYQGDPVASIHGITSGACATPTPQPTAGFDDSDLASVCRGTPLPQADPYAGTNHPLVVAFEQGAVSTGWDVASNLPYEINKKWYGGQWPSPIQLVVCAGQAQARIGSCGTYVRKSDGARGQVIRYRENTPVRVVAARTGKTVASKTFYGTAPACSLTVVQNGDGPPWQIWGDFPDDAVVNAYATTFSTGKVR